MGQRDILRAACAQLFHTPHDKNGLFKQHLDAVQQARERQIDLLVFPETSLTGYPSDAVEGRKIAIWADDPRLVSLAQACCGMTAVVGFVEQARGGHFYNSVVWLQNGQVLKIYRKINLPTFGRLDEGKFFSAGACTQTLEMDRHWICGSLICADAWDPGLLYLSAMRNVTVLALPIASTKEAVGGGFSNEDGWALVARNAAMTYGLPILRCNWIGPHNDMTFWGGSVIFGPHGQTLSEGSDRPGLLSADISYADVVSARQTLPTTRTLSPHVLLGELPSLLS